MGATVHYFMLPEDEITLFRLLARREVTVYPDLIPPGWVPLVADEHTPAKLDGDAYYLALERLGPVIVRPLRRGPDKGKLSIEEIPSPVFHYERSVRNEAGELLAGRIWAELEITDAPDNREGKPYALKRLFLEIQEMFRSSWRRSDPKGWWIGPHTAAAWKRGEVKLREPGHKGKLIGVWR
jgi:hypothetical protein